MLARERQNKIVEMVNEEGAVRVKELSELFCVTEDSIRKDLSLLERKGLLKKTYGGAVKNKANDQELYVSQRKENNVKEKQAIARRAFELIEEGDVIYLDISTINIELVKLILEADIKVTVVTSMIDIMLLFTATMETRVKLIFIGGKFNRGRDGFNGSYTTNQIIDFNFGKAFMGLRGIDIEQDEVYTDCTEDGLSKAVVLKSSDKSYMMLEKKKFSGKSKFRYASIKEFSGIILDGEPDSDTVQKLQEYGVELIY